MADTRGVRCNRSMDPNPMIAENAWARTWRMTRGGAATIGASKRSRVENHGEVQTFGRVAATDSAPRRTCPLTKRGSPPRLAARHLKKTDRAAVKHDQ